MIIISHRGYWDKPEDKNSREAFVRSFSTGYGIETDIRDYNGGLVISHDIARENSMSLKQFFELYKNYGDGLPLALNIKSDGLQKKLFSYIDEFQITNYFVFDMSVPDGLLYIKNNFNVYTRESEIEGSPCFHEESTGIWMDELTKEWITEDKVKKRIDEGKRVCIVSPELHGRCPDDLWKRLSSLEPKYAQDLMICTDYPEKAEVVLHG